MLSIVLQANEQVPSRSGTGKIYQYFDTGVVPVSFDTFCANNKGLAPTPPSPQQHKLYFI
jgi:hypothetical protein